MTSCLFIINLFLLLSVTFISILDVYNIILVQSGIMLFDIYAIH